MMPCRLCPGAVLTISCYCVALQPRVNHINGSIADKDRRIRKLQEELAILRRQVEGLRSEYNNKFVAALNDLGFDAEEITESGEIKFAVRSFGLRCVVIESFVLMLWCPLITTQDGLVLRSVFAEKSGNEEERSSMQAVIEGPAHVLRRTNGRKCYWILSYE